MPRQENASLRHGLVFAWLGSPSDGRLLVDKSQRRSYGAWAGGNPTYQFDGVTFDGTGASGTNKYDVTDRTGLSGNVPFTMSGWMRPTSAYGCICNFGNSGVLVRWDSNGNNIQWSGGTTFMSVSNVIAPNTWCHVCITYPGTTAGDTVLFVNAIRRTLSAPASNVAISYTASAAAFIGVNNTASWHGGQLADVRLYNRVLTPAEIRLLASLRGIGLQPLPDRASGLPRRWSVNVGGTWRAADSYVNVGGTWRLGQPSVNVGGTWK